MRQHFYSFTVFDWTYFKVINNIDVHKKICQFFAINIARWNYKYN